MGIDSEALLSELIETLKARKNPTTVTAVAVAATFAAVDAGFN